MDIYIGGRGQGKTKKLIEISAGKQIPIITFNNRHSEYIKNMAKEMKLNIPKPITFENVRRETIGNHRGLLIDDLDYLLNRMFGDDIHAVSVTDSWVFKLEDIKE